MIHKYFVQKTVAFSLLISFFLAFAQSASATTIALPCYRYSYMETYSVDASALPLWVTVREVVTPGGIYKSYFLDNTSSKPLVVQYKDTYQTQLKLVDSKVYNKSSDATDWFKRTDTSNSAGWNSLYNLVRIDSKIPSPNTYSSNTMPAPIAPVRFTIAAQHNGQPTNITGTLSYTLLEHDCATGKVVVATNPILPTTSPASFSFPQNLSFGMRTAGVSSLQQFLVSQGLLSADLVTGYFGPKTLAAVKAFQSQNGITPVAGFFGPITRAKATAIANGAIY